MSHESRRWTSVGLPVMAAALAFWACQPAGPARGDEKKAPPVATPVAAAAATPGAAAEAPATDQIGQWIRISLPLDNKEVSRVERCVAQVMDRARRQRGRPVLIFEFYVPRNAAEGGRGTQFADALKLAYFLSGDELNRATTVAYLPKPIQGHAVLPALACSQLIMADDATIGAAGVDEPVITDAEQAAYREIAGRRRTLPVELVLGMLHPDSDVLMVRTETATRYVTPAELEQLRKHHTIQSQEAEPLIRKGETAQFTGAQLRKWGFVKRLAGSPLEVVGALHLSPRAVKQDPSQDGKWQILSIRLEGMIDAQKVDQAVRLIDDALRERKVNFVCVWIHSAGGTAAECTRLAEFLADLDPAVVRTVAYIPVEARAQAALVAMACDEIVMQPQAVLGGPGSPQMTSDEIRLAAQTLRGLAKRKLRGWSLWTAMIDQQVEVFRCRRMGETDFFCDEELADQQPKPQQDDRGPAWQKGDLVSLPFKAFSARGAEAVDFGLADHIVANLAELKRIYDLQDDFTLVEPGWTTELAEALCNPGLSALLLVVGGVALYLELNAPGIGVGAFLGTVCFLLFFWSHFLGGGPGWLAISLFLVGLGCLLLEVFVLPGMGVFGLGGGALVLVSLVLACQTYPTFVPRNAYEVGQLQRSLLTVAGAGAGLVVAALMLRRWLPRAPMYRHMVLEPPVGEEARAISRHEMPLDLENLLGTRGVTTTQLTPAGKARFGDALVDVLTTGECLPRNTPVVVRQVHGNRVIVEPVDNSE